MKGFKEIFMYLLILTLGVVFVTTMLMNVIDITTNMRATVLTSINKHTVQCKNGGYVTYSAVRRFNKVVPY